MLDLALRILTEQQPRRTRVDHPKPFAAWPLDPGCTGAYQLKERLWITGIVVAAVFGVGIGSASTKTPAPEAAAPTTVTVTAPAAAPVTVTAAPVAVTAPAAAPVTVTAPAAAPVTVTAPAPPAVTVTAPAASGSGSGPGTGSMSAVTDCLADAMALADTDPEASMRKTAECERMSGN